MSSVTKSAQECLAGMDGAAISAINNPQEFMDMGMSEEDAVFYYAIFQHYKEHGVPTSMLERGAEKRRTNQSSKKIDSPKVSQKN